MRRITPVVVAITVSFLSSAFGQGSTAVKVGYLHTLAVDGHLWTGIENGFFEKYGLEIEPIPFNSGVPLAQALSGGSVDVAIMGAVISNIPSRGVGKVFLVNNIEAGTAMIYVQGDSDIESISDLAGQEISTTSGTTAHVMLATALQANELDPNAAEVVNMDMAAAVSAFISGAVPAVATWWPYNTQIAEQNPDARLLATAGEYFPEAAIMGGWVANTRFYNQNRDTLVNLAKAWLDANAKLVGDTDNTMAQLQATQYQTFDVADLEEGYTLLNTFDNAGWNERYQDGTVESWIGQVEQVFVDIGALETFVDPAEFFDSSIFLEAYGASQ